MMQPPIEERLWGRVERKTNGCLEWTGSTTHAGYGQIMFNGKSVGTHRVAWTLVNGPIPPGISVLHHCDNPPCCEAEGEDHLFLGTKAVNNADMAAKGRHRNQKKDECIHGHAFTEANTYIDKQGKRVCRRCSVDKSVRSQAKKTGPRRQMRPPALSGADLGRAKR